MTHSAACRTRTYLSRHCFTGKERDAETGLDYFDARYYSSNLGRFMSPDWSAKEEPIPYAKLDDPQSLNLYAYVRNNPLVGLDLDGHKPLDCSGNNASGAGCQASAAFDTEHGVDSQVRSDVNAHNQAQQQIGQDPTLPTAVEPPPPSLMDKVGTALFPQTPGEAVSLAIMVGTDGLGEVGEAGAALSKGGTIEKLTTEAKELYPKLAEKADQLHHVIPKYLGGAKDGDLAKIPAAYHQLITNAFRERLAYGVQHGVEAIQQTIKEVYKLFPLP